MRLLTFAKLALSHSPHDALLAYNKMSTEAGRINAIKSLSLITLKKRGRTLLRRLNMSDDEIEERLKAPETSYQDTFCYIISLKDSDKRRVHLKKVREEISAKLPRFSDAVFATELSEIIHAVYWFDREWARDHINWQMEKFLSKNPLQELQSNL